MTARNVAICVSNCNCKSRRAVAKDRLLVDRAEGPSRVVLGDTRIGRDCTLVFCMNWTISCTPFGTLQYVDVV